MANNNVSVEEQIVISANEAIKALQDIKKALKGVKSETKTAGDYIKQGLGAIGITLSLRKTISFLKEANQDAVDLVETTNLFEVSFGKGMGAMNDYYKQAIKFQNQLSEALSTNINESMNFQAIFNAMGTSMGLDKAVAYKISENFTRLGYDLASLYNVETDKAMQKLQSGLSGASTRPLRSFGIDITQGTLANTLSDLGISRKLSSLSQAEKMVLRYIAVMKQASIANGDFARTLSSPANQLRIFQAQLLSLRQNIGGLWQGVLQQWMPYINAMLMVINALIRALASFFGIKVASSISQVSANLADASDSAGGVASGLSSAGGSAKKLKDTLSQMSWDEIHNIDLNDDSSSGGGGGVSGGAGGGIDQSLLDAMLQYDSVLGQIDNKATEIRDKIMDWLGFEKQINEETGEIEWKLRNGYQNIELIRDVLVGIASTVMIGKLAKLISKVGGLGGALKGLKDIAGNLLLSIGLTTEFFGIKDNDLKEKLIGVLEVGFGAGFKWGAVNGLNAGLLTFDLMLAISMVKWSFENFDDVKKGIYGDIDKKDLTLGQRFNVEMSAVGQGALNELAGLAGYDPMTFEEWGKAWNEYFKNVKEGAEKWSEDTQGVFDAFFEVTGTHLGQALDDMLSKGLGFETSWDEVVNTVTDEKAWDQYWTDVKTGAGIWRDDMLSKALGFETTWDEFTKTVTDKKSWDQYWEDVKTGAGNWKEDMLGKFGKFKEGALKKWEEFKKGVKDIIDEVKKYVGDKIEDIKKFFDTEFKFNIKIPRFDISYNTDGLIASAFQKMGLPGRPEINVTWRANGGFPEMGEMFIAREAGPELVGTIGNKTAVANNDQIIEGITAGVYQAVASAMSQYGGVQIEAKIEEGILLKKVQNQAQQYRMQTGKAPFPTM